MRLEHVKPFSVERSRQGVVFVDNSTVLPQERVKEFLECQLESEFRELLTRSEDLCRYDTPPSIHSPAKYLLLRESSQKAAHASQDGQVSRDKDSEREGYETGVARRL